MCGGLRAVNDLTHGRWLDALSSNAFVVLLVALGAGVLAVWGVRRAVGSGDEQVPLLSRRALPWTVLAVGVVFGVLRWTTPLAWFAP